LKYLNRDNENEEERMITLRELIFFCMILLPMTIALGQQGPSSQKGRPEILSRQVTMPNSAPETIQSAFSQILVDAHAAGGIVNSSSCLRAQEHDFGGAKTSLDNALDMIVASEPENKWLIADGVVNLVPAGDLPGLLNVPISYFKIKNARTVLEALDQLMAVPEVGERVAQLHLEELSRHVGLSDLKRPGTVAEDRPALNLSRRNVTLCGALNAIASAHGSAVWAYTERHCNGRDQFSLDFLVR
jgi:hypothetical protein